MNLYWFTEEDGNLCLGTEPTTLASLVISTDIIASPPIERLLTDDELRRLGDPTKASVEDVQAIAEHMLSIK